MRIALVNPPDTAARGVDGEEGPPPLGLASIAAYLRQQGWTVDLYDLAHTEPDDVALLERTGFFDHDVFGFTSYTKTFPATQELVRRVKGRCPDAVVVLGGPHATPCAEDLLVHNPSIDYVVKSDGEVPMAELVAALHEGRTVAAVPSLVWRAGPVALGGLGVRVNPPPDDPPALDDLPFPARDYVVEPPRVLYERRGHDAPVEVAFMSGARGCPKRCSFCSIIVMNPKWKARSAPSLMAEIRQLYEARPFGHIAFMDANSFVHSKRTLEFSDALWEWNPEVTWSGTATADAVRRHADVIMAVGKNCAYMEIGIESGSDSVLKRFNKRTTVADNEAAMRLLRRAGIALELDFIMFDPWTTVAEVRENLSFLERNELLGYFPTDHLYNAMRLYPGTTAYDECPARFGVEPGSFPELVPPFEHPAVDALHKTLMTYRHIVQTRSDVAAAVIDAHVAEVIEQCPELDAIAVRTVQHDAALAIRLRHAPYRVFAAALDLAEQDPDALTGDLRPFEREPFFIELCALVAEAEDRAAALSRAKTLTGVMT